MKMDKWVDEKWKPLLYVSKQFADQLGCLPNPEGGKDSSTVHVNSCWVGNASAICVSKDYAWQEFTLTHYRGQQEARP